MTAYFKNHITVWHEQVLITMVCKDEVIVSFLCEYVYYTSPLVILTMKRKNENIFRRCWEVGKFFFQSL